MIIYFLHVIHQLYLNYRIPPIEELQESIEELNSLDLNNISVDDLKKKLYNAFQIFHHGEVIWDSRFYVFRVRRNKNNEFEPWKNISDIGIRPKDGTPIGRANNPNQPVFYGCHSEDLPLFESCQNLDEFDRWEPQNFTMGIWKIKQSESLRLVPIVDSLLVHESRGDIKSFSKKMDENHEKYFTIPTLNERIKLIRNFFADQFAKPIHKPSDYKISAFFAQTIWDMNNFQNAYIFDGILYPSVARKFKSDNVALTPESLRKLEPVICLMFTAYNFNFYLGTITKGILMEGNVKGNGDIDWKDALTKSKI